MQACNTQVVLRYRNVEGHGTKSESEREREEREREREREMCVPST